jgi:hypothetical protein
MIFDRDTREEGMGSTNSPPSIRARPECWDTHPPIPTQVAKSHSNNRKSEPLSLKTVLTLRTAVSLKPTMGFFKIRSFFAILSGGGFMKKNDKKLLFAMKKYKKVSLYVKEKGLLNG